MKLGEFTNNEAAKFIMDFEIWLMKDYPKSVAHVRENWKKRRKELSRKIMDKFDSKLRAI